MVNVIKFNKQQGKIFTITSEMGRAGAINGLLFIPNSLHFIDQRRPVSGKINLQLSLIHNRQETPVCRVLLLHDQQEYNKGPSNQFLRILVEPPLHFSHQFPPLLITQSGSLISFGEISIPRTVKKGIQAVIQADLDDISICEPVPRLLTDRPGFTNN